MSDSFATEQKTDTSVPEVKSKRGRGRSVANITAKAADNLRVDTDQRIKFKRDQPRAKGLDLELNLSVPEGTIPAGYVGLWVTDNGKGEVEQKLAEWWGHVSDAQGVNITKPSAGRTSYLMAIEQKYKDEIDELQMKRYRDSIGETDRALTSSQNVEAYDPEGVKNSIKIRNDGGSIYPFS